MNKDFAFELRREILHIAMGLVIIWLAYNYAHVERLLFCILVAGVIISFLSLYTKVPFFWQMLKIFERPQYMGKFPGKGVIFYLAGCLLALKLFSLNIASASIMILAFGDSFSHLLGKLIKNNEKEIESAIVGMITATIAAHFFVGWILAFIGASIAMAAEFIEIRFGQDNVDDNLFVPIIAGTIIYLGSKILAIIF